MKSFMILFLCVLFLFSQMVSAQEKIIFDTDMNGDVDDVGALALLHAFADLGEAEILACMTSEPHPMVSECIDAINTWYNKPDIPIGALRGSGGSGSYVTKVAERYPHDATRETLPEPVPLYRSILGGQPDSSVTIVSVGFLPNLGQLLKTSADEHSPLDGISLVAQKVKLWICMGGEYPVGKEYNLANKYAEDAWFAIENWPTPVIFTGHEIGRNIDTAKEIHGFISESPVRLGYENFYCSWAFDGNPYWAWEHGHYSWDPSAVWMGVRGLEPLWGTVGDGYNQMSQDGANVWIDTTDRNHAYATVLMPHDEVALRLDSLMNQTPVGYFDATPSSGWMPLDVLLDATHASSPSAESIQSWTWNFGDGESGNGITANHTYASPGDFQLSLSVEDGSGREGQRHRTLNVYDPVFASHPLWGHAGSFLVKNQSNWISETDAADLRLKLRTENIQSNSSQVGEYALTRDSSYQDFRLTLTARSGENLAEVTTVDYAIVFGFLDDTTFCTMQMRNKTSSLYVVESGRRKRVINASRDGIPDGDYHTVVLQRQGSTIEVFLDGEVILSVADERFGQAGLLGVGSSRYAVYFDDIQVSREVVLSGVRGGPSEKPAVYFLGQNYPNPFNPRTTIPYHVPGNGHVHLRIFDARGRRIRTLADSEHTAGHHQVIWDGLNEESQNMPSGIYFYRIEAGTFRDTNRLLLLK